VATKNDASRKNFSQLDSLFMYTQILKEILLLTIKFDKHYINEFIDNNRVLNIVKQFKRKYHDETSIWYDTCECFLYLQHMQQLTKTKGGLISFNNFLYISKNPNVLLDLVAILLIMNIDSSKSTTSFASTSDLSYFHGEDQVLFLMRTLFRIRDIKPIGENNRLYEVNLTLTTDNDKDLHTLINHIREEIFPNTKECHQLNLLLLKTDHSDKAQKVYQVILDQTTNENQRGSIYRQFGLIKYIQGQYTEPITLDEKSINIHQTTLSQNHPNSSISYTGIANAYSRIGCTQ